MFNEAPVDAEGSGHINGFHTTKSARPIFIELQLYPTQKSGYIASAIGRIFISIQNQSDVAIMVYVAAQDIVKVVTGAIGIGNGPGIDITKVISANNKAGIVIRHTARIEQHGDLEDAQDVVRIQSGIVGTTSHIPYGNTSAKVMTEEAGIVVVV